MLVLGFGSVGLTRPFAVKKRGENGWKRSRMKQAGSGVGSVALLYPVTGNKRQMSFSPRRVRTTPTVVLYECRLLKSSLKPASVLRYVEGKIKKWRGVQRWYLQCYLSPRGEVVIQSVVERVAAVCRVDNLIQAWRKIAVKMIPGAPLAKQIKRSVWCQDMLVDVRVMVETWESACAKLGAEASVDGGAVKCSYLEPALPSTIPELSNVVSKLNVSVPPGTLNTVGVAGVASILNDPSVAATRTEGVRKDSI